MAFRALLFSKSPITNAGIIEACTKAGIRTEVCSDIFTAIDNAKARAFSCVIIDWANQPEASFLVKRARESEPNRATLAIAIVEHDPTQAELRDSKLDFLIHTPLAEAAVATVLAEACAQMKPLSADDVSVKPEATNPTGNNKDKDKDKNNDNDNSNEQSAISSSGNEKHHLQNVAAESFQASTLDGEQDSPSVSTVEPGTEHQRQAMGLRQLIAIALLLAAAFCVWNYRDTFEYLAHTPEGKLHVLHESVAALFYANKTGALPISSAGADAHDDAYFSRESKPDAGTVALAVAATESKTEVSAPLPKPADFPLPQPSLERQDVQPVHIQHAAIPDSIKNSGLIERPVVVASVNPALMPVTAQQPLPQTATQQVNEPVTLSEDVARTLLVHTVDAVYPADALGQKLHGPVVLQIVVARDGSVQDLKILHGYFLLGKAAIAAVKEWRFQPYTLSGHAVSTQTVITVNFNSPTG